MRPLQYLGNVGPLSSFEFFAFQSHEKILSFESPHRPSLPRLALSNFPTVVPHRQGGWLLCLNGDPYCSLPVTYPRLIQIYLLVSGDVLLWYCDQDSISNAIPLNKDDSMIRKNTWMRTIFRFHYFYSIQPVQLMPITCVRAGTSSSILSVPLDTFHVITTHSL